MELLIIYMEMFWSYDFYLRKKWGCFNKNDFYFGKKWGAFDLLPLILLFGCLGKRNLIIWWKVCEVGSLRYDIWPPHISHNKWMALRVWSTILYCTSFCLHIPFIITRTSKNTTGARRNHWTKFPKTLYSCTII